jgi:hypothetical protein
MARHDLGLILRNALLRNAPQDEERDRLHTIRIKNLHRVFTTSCHALFTNAFEVNAREHTDHCLCRRRIGV